MSQPDAEAAAPCALLHLCLVLHGSLTLIQYDFVEREAERLCCVRALCSIGERLWLGILMKFQTSGCAIWVG
jgi:hypothetical protein